MFDTKRFAAALVALVPFATLGLAGSVQAQTYYQPAPLYPYAAQPQVIYATPQAAPQPYPYVRSTPAAKPKLRAESKIDPALIEELRKRRHDIKQETKAETKPSRRPEPPLRHKHIDKTIIVRDKPVVRNHYRVIDDPPVIVQREIDESQLAPAPAPQLRAQQANGGRVIHAEAEVTILGPDRMSIRLYRKGDGRDANAKAVSKIKKE
jgi:hypothetical protein